MAGLIRGLGDRKLGFRGKIGFANFPSLRTFGLHLRPALRAFSETFFWIASLNAREDGKLDRFVVPLTLHSSRRQKQKVWIASSLHSVPLLAKTDFGEAKIRLCER